METALLRAVAYLLGGSFLVWAQGSAPTIDPRGVVNAADYTPAIAPGMIVAVFGGSLAPKVTSASSVPLPTVLDGTSVEVNGQAIPLFFVSPKQINAQMPFGISGQAEVRVRSSVDVSAAATVTFVASAPKLLTKTMDGKGEPILCHGADWSLVSTDSPARAGEILTLFLTGLGAVSPTIAAGQPGGDNGQYGPVNQLPAGAVTVAFGGKQAAILFAGLAPGWVGLYQVNFQVPSDLPRGMSILVVSTREGTSQAGVQAAAEGTVGPIIAMEFVSIPAGEFMMGCSPGDNECSPDEGPSHRVQITKSFEIAKYEVTQAQWEAVMGSSPSYFQGSDRPVERVSWNDAQGFLTRLNARNDGYRYRLPTEAEWEYAARAGSTDKYAGGQQDEVAWYGQNSGGQTHSVGQKKPNRWGLYDMLGNVWEWCQDWYDPNYYSKSPVPDPPGPASGSLRLTRGGSYNSITSVNRLAYGTRVSVRDEPAGPDSRYSNVGFRCVRERP